ncbi:tetratricopeptide repeat protein [Halobacteriovorax sp. HLS]|uniref:tetratricopeptide repeat protein n=1 Tax=Halobacteriovorax sp. HLS TaxID=2234000 RepID=UPI000FD71785|nr:tetratricopeptide repeat protein [Halobacteriovorax sp. HLS]
MSDILDKAIELRKSGNFEESLKLLIEELGNNSESALLNYHAAWACDCLGREKDAAPFYEKAIANGLSGNDLRDAYLGLGSTYRCVGKYEESLALFEKAIMSFPNDKELVVFRTLTLYNLGKHEESFSTLLNLLADTTNDEGIKGYASVLKNYSKCLSKIW